MDIGQIERVIEIEPLAEPESMPESRRPAEAPVPNRSSGGGL